MVDRVWLLPDSEAAIMGRRGKGPVDASAFSALHLQCLRVGLAILFLPPSRRLPRWGRPLSLRFLLSSRLRSTHFAKDDVIQKTGSPYTRCSKREQLCDPSVKVVCRSVLCRSYYWKAAKRRTGFLAFSPSFTSAVEHRRQQIKCQ